MNVAIAAYPEPLAGRLLENDQLVAILAVALTDDQRTPRFLIAHVDTGMVSYVDASEVVLFPVLPGTGEEDLGE